MVEVVASSILGMVFDKLRSIAIEDLRSLWGGGESEELKKLKRTLSNIKDRLEDAEARQAEEKVIVRWLKDLKDATYDVDDVLDVVVAEACKPNPLKGTHGEMVRKLFSFPQSLQFRYEIAKKIKVIREKLDIISKENVQYNLMSKGAAEHHPESKINISERRETSSHVDKSQVVGRDTDKEVIIDFLLNKCNEQNLGVISIVGPGGVGKTTLAQLVYSDDEHVSKHFKTKIWVYVSEKFNVKNIIKSIIESLTKKKPRYSSMDLIEQELLEQIEGKKFLLVLDDVWNKDYHAWEKLKRLLRNGAKGSKVIVTTESKKVAPVMKSAEKLSLSELPEDECWKLFQSRAFGSSADATNNSNLVGTGKEILKKCVGLPLAVKALGSLMCFKGEESQWKAVRDSKIWTLSEDNVDKVKILPALILSYNHLSSGLKQCFAFCSIFPKGEEIEFGMLVQLWVAEGFVIDLSNGSKCVEHLISRSLLERHVEDHKDYVKMHDLVHDLARFVAGDECSIIDATIGSNTNDVLQKSRQASLIRDEMTQSITQILTKGQKLRTLHLIWDKYRIYSEKEEDIHQEVINTIVSRIKFLRSLYLPTLSIKELPATIKELVHLRYLNLSDTKLESLPETIGKLVHLQHLHLSNLSIGTLPPTIGTLGKLQTLDLSYCEKLGKLPESICGLKNLLTLNLSRCTSLHSLPDGIGCIRSLQVLDISHCNALETLPESLSSLYNLQRLDLRNCCRLQKLPKNLQNMRSLKHLNTENCVHVLDVGDRSSASLDEIAREIENKMAIEPTTASSSSSPLPLPHSPPPPPTSS